MTVVLENNTVASDKIEGSSEGFPGQPPVSDPNWWRSRVDDIRAQQARELPEDYVAVTDQAVEYLAEFMASLYNTGVSRRFPIFPLEDGGFQVQFRRGQWLYSALIRSEGPHEYYIIPVRGPGTLAYEAETIRHLVSAFGVVLVGYAD